MQGLIGRYSVNHLPRLRSLVIPTKMLPVADKVLEIQQKRMPCVFSDDGRIHHNSELPTENQRWLSTFSQGDQCHGTHTFLAFIL